MTEHLHASLETPAAALFMQVGILHPGGEVPSHLKLFVEQADQVLDKVQRMIGAGELAAERGHEFQQLLVDACARVLCHPIVASNNYLRRFADEFSPPVARAMLLGAETYTADRLHDIGGVHRLGTLDAALDWADQLAALAPLTIAGHKLALEHRTVVPDPVAEVEAARAVAWASDDAVEGRKAFLGKRAAHFTGT